MVVIIQWSLDNFINGKLRHNIANCWEISEKYYRPAEVDLLYGCSKETREVLNWEPKVKLDNGLREMISYRKNF